MTDNESDATKPQTPDAAEAATGKPVTLDTLDATASPEPEAVDAAAERIAELETRVAQLEEQKLRLAADVQNTVRRAERDKRDAETYGGTKLARDLLGVYDNLDAAIAQASEELREREAAFFSGVDLTRKELLKAFSKHKIEIVRPDEGDRFDPNQHQAMFEAPVPGATPGSVIQVMQAGFMIADRLLRPAMVGVASAASPQQPAAASEESDAEAKAE